MNRVEFDVAMVRNGLSVPRLAGIIGMSKATLYRKLEAGNFNRNEIISIKNAMRLSDHDILAIFFSCDCCENSTKEKN